MKNTVKSETKLLNRKSEKGVAMEAKSNPKPFWEYVRLKSQVGWLVVLCLMAL